MNPGVGVGEGSSIAGIVTLGMSMPKTADAGKGNQAARKINASMITPCFIGL